MSPAMELAGWAHLEGRENTMLSRPPGSARA